MDLPNDVAGWFDLAWKLGAALGALWALAVATIRRPLLHELNGLGTRVKQVEEDSAAHDGRLGALERVDETHSFQVSTLSERQGRLEGRQDHAEQAIETILRQVEGRLGNIEGQLKILTRGRER